MLSYLGNQNLIEKGFQNPSEQLFIQKIKELLYNSSGVSYSYKIHNLYSILLELKGVIEYYSYQRTNGYILEEVRKEAVEILQNDLVMSKMRPALYETLRDELRKGLSIDKNKQAIKDEDKEKIDSIYNAIKNVENIYKIMDYLSDTLDLLKLAIQNNESEKIISLSECLISSVIITGRSIANCFLSFGRFFENSGKSFWECWSQWASSLFLNNAEYKCFFLIDERYAERVNDSVRGTDICEKYSSSTGRELIEADKKYFVVELEAPSNDQYTIVEKAFDAYRNEMGIVEFATAKVKELQNKVLVFDVYFNRFISLEREKYLVSVEYKPYNQYHKNIDQLVRRFVQSLPALDQNKVMNAIINTCNFEKESKEYSFLLLWSSLEALFRSNQYPTAITAIKDIVPNILSHRYLYYRLFDFLKECSNIDLTYQYKGNDLIVENVSTEQIKLLYELLRNDTDSVPFLQACKNAYELLYYRGVELKNILKNAVSIRQKIERHRQVLSYQLQRMYRIRNKFVHHSIVDDNIDVLCKHIRVYMWEAIREMSYVATRRKITTLEELYGYFRMNHTMMQKMLINANSPIEIENIVNGYL